MLSILIPAFLLSFSACLDNVVVGIAYGMKKIKIGFLQNLIIAIVSSTGTLLSMMFGQLLARFIPISICSALGATMIILIGIYFILDYIISNKKNYICNKCQDIIDCKICIDNELAVKTCNSISIKESIMLAFALTINNLGIGISASLTGINIPITVLLTFILSLLTIYCGTLIGNNIIGRILGRFASLASGTLMIILGIIELF